MFIFIFFLIVGLSGAAGDKWKINRQNSLKYMRALRYGNKDMERVIMTEVNALSETLRSSASEAHDMQPMFMKAMYRAVCALTFGRINENDKQTESNFFLEMRDLMKGFAGGNPFTLFSYLRWLPGDLFGLKELDKKGDRVLDFCRAFIEQRKLLLSAEESEVPYDLVGRMYLDMTKTQPQDSAALPTISGMV